MQTQMQMQLSFAVWTGSRQRWVLAQLNSRSIHFMSQVHQIRPSRPIYGRVRIKVAPCAHYVGTRPTKVMMQSEEGGNPSYMLLRSIRRHRYDDRFPRPPSSGAPPAATALVYTLMAEPSPRGIGDRPRHVDPLYIIAFLFLKRIGLAPSKGAGTSIAVPCRSRWRWEIIPSADYPFPSEAKAIALVTRPGQ